MNTKIPYTRAQLWAIIDGKALGWRKAGPGITNAVLYERLLADGYITETVASSSPRSEDIVAPKSTTSGSDNLNDYYFFYSSDPLKAKANNGDVSAALLSNWSIAPFVIGGIRFNSTEQWLMYSKAKLFGDHEMTAQILATGAEYSVANYKGPSPTTKAQNAIMATVKKLGRQVKNFDEGAWNGQRKRIMLEGLTAKFTQHAASQHALLATGTRIIAEAAPRDRIWGIGMNAESARRLADSTKWRGQNLLGNALMAVRHTLNGN